MAGQVGERGACGEEVRTVVRSRWLRSAATLASVLVVTGSAVLVTGEAAVAAPHFKQAPSVQIGYTDSADDKTAYDWAAGVNLPVGAWQDDAGRTHLSRVYATFDIRQFTGKRILGGVVRFREYAAADCSKRAIEIWWTKTVNKTPTWATPPDELQKLDEILTPEFCPANIAFDVSAAVADAVAHDKHRVTFEIRVPEQLEGDLSYGRRLNWYNSVGLTVQYNSPPIVVEQHRYNAGFPCATEAPYPVQGPFVGRLEALGSDADTSDQYQLKFDFAVWPQDDSAARVELAGSSSSAGRVSRADVPSELLVDGRTYSWQVRVGDGVDTSAWSNTCSFTADRNVPSAPQVTSSNYPPADSGEETPLGEPGQFTFTATTPDTVGFEYGWGELSVPGCTLGNLGQLVCADPFSQPRTVRANAPGGSATVLLNPPLRRANTLRVRAIDAGGWYSSATSYEFIAPWGGEPIVTVVGGEPQWGQPVTLKFAPDPAISGTVSYEYSRDNGPLQTVAAGADGTATISFVSDNLDGHTVTVRSHSANGWVSPEAQWFHYYGPWPGVSSDIYLSNNQPVGGVGVTGHFTFSPPPGWTAVQGYRYSFGGDFEFVAAGADGRATITWTPEVSGDTYLEVYAVRPDGSWSYSNLYYFIVA